MPVLCTFMGAQFGRVLAALAEAGLGSDTRILYLSDHGENLGARRLWGKSAMYEESAAIPMILSGRMCRAANAATRRCRK